MTLDWPEDFNVALAELCGLPPEVVRSLSVTAAAGQMPTLVAEMYPAAPPPPPMYDWPQPPWIEQ